MKWPFLLREISGHSMMPVLPPGTYVIGWRWYRSIKPGNIIVFTHEGKEKIKRVSEVKDSQVHVLGDHHVASTDSRHFGWLDMQHVTAKIIWPRAPKHRAEGIEKED